MTRAAITVENLSKAYHIGLKQDRADTLVGALQGLVRAPLAQLQHLRRMNTFKHQDDADDIYWALKDVSFEVAEGEVVGIIGRNGAGKSTLLKILSRITEPTSGRALIRGRVSSLLEVGTGFHQELSGRENVYMNGTILGMTKREIDRKFDEIVDFSGVEKFLDTPIKHYSSGMKVRLAFAVAAHLEPEILIIDEVLAVGDFEFQKKCIGKMQDVASAGRTVLFVSHNLSAVRSLTRRCAFLQGGKLRSVGFTNKIIDEYISHSVDLRQEGDAEDLSAFRHPAISKPPAEILAIDIAPSRGGRELPRLKYGEPLTIEFLVNVRADLNDLKVTAFLTRDSEQLAVTLYSRDAAFTGDGSQGKQRISCTISAPLFSPGRYCVEAHLLCGERFLDKILDYPLFEIDADPEELGIIDWFQRPWGAIHLNDGVIWESSYVAADERRPASLDALR